MVSAHNPFRTPGVTPDTTGLSSASFPSISSSRADIHDGGAGRAHSASPSPPPEELPGLGGPEPPRAPVPAPSPPRPDPAEDILLEELPPAYTPAADVRHGETTIEVGPRRPFQPAQQPPHQDPRFMSPAPTGWQYTGAAGSWPNHPGQMHPQPTGASHLAPPPLHPASSGRGGPPRPSSAPTDAPLSDFARDFYAALPGAGGNASAPSGESSRSSVASSSRDVNEPSNDGRPTSRPTPGHPLMRNGRVLVYPAGFECHKCSNMGFKNNDPSHPCSKCWERYARPFSGALAYAPWSSSGSTESGGARVTLQRPLPSFRAPQRAVSTHRQTQSYGAPLLRPPPQGYQSGSGSYSRVIPTAGGGVPMSPYLDRAQRSSYASSPTSVMPSHAPPPGAAVVRPGDPRIGGRLCWRCGGTGMTTFLIFDEMTCTVCNGLGRTFA